MELYDAERDGTRRSVFAEINDDGAFQMTTQDLGAQPAQVLGRDEYEFMVTVARERKDELLLALVRELFSGHERAVEELREILNRGGVIHNFGTWL